MADSRKTYVLRDDALGRVRISEEIIPAIAAMAATEVDGVSCVAGNITHEIVNRMGARNLEKGIRSVISGDEVSFDISVNASYGRNIMDAAKEVQERVKTTVESMTGLRVTSVRVRVNTVDLGENE